MTIRKAIFWTHLGAGVLACLVIVMMSVTGVVLTYERQIEVGRFFSTIRGWHRWLDLSGDARATGRAITGASNLLFLFLVVSGICL